MLKEEDRTKGLLLNLTGDGKGKSSSAFGIAVRALGWEWRVAVFFGVLILSHFNSILHGS